MVNIYLNMDGVQVLFLSIPLNDIQRLSVRPLKWLRFVTFAVCGARGDLSELAGGPAVNYDITSFADLIDNYYYVSYGDFIFVDCHGSNDRITSSAQTPRRSTFRRDVIQRDGPFCVITGEVAAVCDAAHIIPKRKGNEYINKVIQDRSILYDNAGLEIAGINAVENGILLRKDLHAKVAIGSIAFLKTPNFALNPDDIPSVESSPTPANRTTLQYLEPPEGRGQVPGFNAVFGGTGNSPPLAILLDYMYGILAYMRWVNGQDGRNVMERYFLGHYKLIPTPPSEPSTDGTDYDESDDSRDSDYKPGEPRAPPKQRHHSHMWDGMIKAMDSLNFRIMGLRGITPEVWAAQQQQKEEEEQKASRDKVLDWLTMS